MDPRRRSVYTLKITEVHPKVVHAPAVVMNDLTVAHDENDPRYDPALAAKYDSTLATAHAAAGQATTDALSEASTVSATEDMDTTDANRQTMSDVFRQEKAAHFVARQQQGQGLCSHPYRIALSRSLSAVSAAPSATSSAKRRWQLGRSASLHTNVSDSAESRSDVINTAGISRLSSSTLKLLGMHNHIGSSAAAAARDSCDTLSSSAGVGDNICHDDLLLTMAKRLNDAAARSSRSTVTVAVTPNNSDSGETVQSSMETSVQMSRGKQDSDNTEVGIRRSQQTDGPPYHDSEDDTDGYDVAAGMQGGDNDGVGASTVDSSKEANQSEYCTLSDGTEATEKCDSTDDMCRQRSDTDSVTSQSYVYDTVADWDDREHYGTVKLVSPDDIGDASARHRSDADSRTSQINDDDDGSLLDSDGGEHCDIVKPVSPADTDDTTSSRNNGHLQSSSKPSCQSEIWSASCVEARMRSAHIVLHDITSSDVVINAHGTCHLSRHSADTMRTSSSSTADTGLVKDVVTGPTNSSAYACCFPSASLSTISSSARSSPTLPPASETNIAASTQALPTADFAAESDTSIATAAVDVLMPASPLVSVSAGSLSSTTALDCPAVSSSETLLYAGDSDYADTAAVAKETTTVSPSISVSSCNLSSSAVDSSASACNLSSAATSSDAGADNLYADTAAVAMETTFVSPSVSVSGNNPSSLSSATDPAALASDVSLPETQPEAGAGNLCTDTTTVVTQSDAEADNLCTDTTSVATETTAVSPSVSVSGCNLSSSASAVNSSASSCNVSSAATQSDAEADNLCTYTMLVTMETTAVSPSVSVSGDNPSSSAAASASDVSLPETQSEVGADNVCTDTGTVAVETTSASLSSSASSDVESRTGVEDEQSIDNSQPPPDNTECCSSGDDTEDTLLPASATHSQLSIDDKDDGVDDVPQTDVVDAAKTSVQVQAGANLSQSSHSLGGISAESESESLSGGVSGPSRSEFSIDDKNDDVDDDCSLPQPDVVDAAKTGVLQTDATLPQSSHSLGGISDESENETLSGGVSGPSRSQLSIDDKNDGVDDVDGDGSLPQTDVVGATETGVLQTGTTLSPHSLGGISAKSESESETLSGGISGPVLAGTESQAVTESCLHSDIVSASQGSDEVSAVTRVNDAASAGIQASVPVVQTVPSSNDSSRIPVSASLSVSASCQLSLTPEAPSVIVKSTVLSPSVVCSASSSSSSAAAAAAAVTVPLSRSLTCRLSSLNQLLASAKQSRPYFIHVVPRSSAAEAAASPCDGVPASSALHQSETSITSNSDSAAVVLHEKVESSGSDGPHATVSSSQQAAATTVSTGANKLKRLLQSDGEPLAKRVCVTGSKDVIPVLIDGSQRVTGIEHQQSSSPSLAGPRSRTANEGGYRMARATINSRDLWARPKSTSDQSGTLHTEQRVPAQAGSQPSDHLATQQITLQPTSPGFQPTAASCGAQPRDFKITLQAGTQPAVLSDRSNYSTSLPTRGRHRSNANSRTTRTGQSVLFHHSVAR